MVGACSQELDIIQEADSHYYLEKHDAKKTNNSLFRNPKSNILGFRTELLIYSTLRNSGHLKEHALVLLIDALTTYSLKVVFSTSMKLSHKCRYLI
jgi:hypothetical protein